jgi:PAS domain S-box-containing protein
LTNEAIETGLAALDELGLPLLESEPAGVSVQAISELAPMTDPQASAAAELFDSLLLPAHVFKPKLLPSLTYTALHLNLQFGWHPSSCMIAMAYAVFVWPEDIDKAHRFGQLALQLSERPEAYRYLCQVRAGVNAYLSPWKSHYRTIEQALRDTVQIGLDIGDKAYAMSSLVNSSILNIFLRDRLDQAQENMTQDIHLLQGSGEQFNLYSLLVWTQLVVNLRGRSNDPLCFEGPHFDEASDLPLAQAAGLHQTTIFLHLLKLILHYHLGHFQTAFAYSEEAELFLPNFRSYYLIPLHPFYQSLAILQLPDRQGQPAKLVEKIEQNLQKLQLWAQHAPMNHQHKVDLILAEQARVAGDIAAAMDHYEAAIAGAKDNEYLHEEALANELYGRFWIERGKDHFAEKFIHEAHALYSRWGAGAIVEYLEAQYPQWLKVKSIDTGPLRPSIDIKELQVDLDLQTVIKASQAIASELELDRLLGILMDIVLENSGAQQSLLLWEQEGEWVIQAAVAAGQSHPQAMQAIRLSDFDGVAHSIVHYVARTQKTVILGDAAHTGQFVQDPYLQRRQVKSLLCMPLLNQRQSNGILYLENNLAADVFTPDRVALLDVLSSQMSISLDNALLYDQLKNLLSEQTEALKNSENQVQTLFENTPLGIALIDHEGGFLAFNQSLGRMLGYSEAETQKLNMTSLYHGPGQGTEILEKLQTSATVRNFGVEVVRKDGTSFYASLNASKLSQSEQDIYLAVIEDVSERIRAQQALQESQLRLANIIETAQEAVLTVNEDQKLTLFNPAAERMFGFERNDIVGRPLDVLLPERFRTEHADHILTFAQTNVTARSMGNLGNLWGRRANGEEFPIEVSISQVKLANERLYTAFVQDVTERKKAEQALQERIKELNFLYSVSELVDRLWPALEEILQGVVELIPAAWQYPEITCARIVLKDQEFRTENFAVSPWQQTIDIIVFGEQTGTVEVYYLEERPESQEGIFLSEERSLIKEISERLGRTIERVMVEDALQASEEKYRDLVENISDVIYTIDTEGKITYISPAVESSLEYKPAEILGQSFLQFFSISSLDRGKENYQQLIHGKSPGPNEYQMQTKSGEIRWGQTSSKPIFDGEDQVVGVQGVMTDITERKMLEAQMQELATLEERNRIARELHDSVTQSLYSINLQSDATLMALSSGKTESAERRLQMLKDTAQESMAEMRLLIYELHPSILEEAGLVAALKQRLETVELRSGVEVDLQIEDEQRLPIAVEYELFKISLEGLNNVLKHAKAKEVLVQVSFEHNRCRLTIKDDGMGFDHGNIGRYGGDGLANIKDRVEQIGGELTVITEPGKGTTLEVEVLYE